MLYEVITHQTAESPVMVRLALQRPSHGLGPPEHFALGTAGQSHVDIQVYAVKLEFIGLVISFQRLV